MNLSYIVDYIETKGDSITKQDLDNLVNEIKAVQETETALKDITVVMRVINGYNADFLTRVQEFEIISKEGVKSLPKKAEKVREILCTLSKLHTYLTLSVNNIKESTFNMKNLRSYINELNEKREHFKSEKVTWATILRSISTEMTFHTEMRKMDIEDEIGYFK